MNVILAIDIAGGSAVGFAGLCAGVVLLVPDGGRRDPFASRGLPDSAEEWTGPLVTGGTKAGRRMTADLKAKGLLLARRSSDAKRRLVVALDKTSAKDRLRKRLASLTPAAGYRPRGTVAPPAPVLSPPQDPASAGQENLSRAMGSPPVPQGPRHARCRTSPRQRAAAAAWAFIRGQAAATWDAYLAFLKARQLPRGLPLPVMTSAPAVAADAPERNAAGAEPALEYATPEGSLRALLSEDTIARGMGAARP